MGFSRQEYWCEFLCPPPDLPDPGVESISTASLALQAGSLPTEPPWKPLEKSEKEEQIKTQVRAKKEIIKIRVAINKFENRNKERKSSSLHLPSEPNSLCFGEYFILRKNFRKQALIQCFKIF